LNTPEALSLMWKLIREEKEISNKDKLDIILGFDKVFGLRLNEIKVKEEVPAEVQRLIAEREEARKDKDYKKSDELRKKIKQLGFDLQDAKDGVKLRKV